MNKTKIEWCDVTINPFHGCSKISEGCANCYAERMAGRLQAMGTAGYEGGFTVKAAKDRLRGIYSLAKARKPMSVFIGSMGDFGHHQLSHAYRDDILRACELANLQREKPHTFLFLTKRPEVLVDWAGGQDLPSWSWWGASASNQLDLDRVVPPMLQLHGNRYLSLEPLLGEVDLHTAMVKAGSVCDWCGGFVDSGHDCYEPSLGFHAVILGGESGPNARPMGHNAARSARDDEGKRVSGANPLDQMVSQ